MADANEIDKEIELLKKRKELLEARQQLAALEKSMADAAKPASAEAAELAAAKATKELAEAQKAAADARKAASDADLAAVKAAVGEVPASGVTGTVDAKENTGELEAALLAMAAVRDAGRIIGDRIRAALPDKARIVLFSAAEAPTFSSMLAYDAERMVAQALLEKAIANATPQPEAGRAESLEAFPVVAAAGLALDATSKILSFFRTDVTVKGLAVSLEDSAALSVIADTLSRGVTPNDGKTFTVTIPALYDPTARNAGVQGLIDDFGALSAVRVSAQQRLTEIEGESATRATAIAAETDPGRKQVLEAEQSKAADLIAGLKGALAFMDAWLTRLGAPDGKGVAPLVHVVREKALAAALDGGQFLAVKIQKAGGGVLTKRNLWTFFGTMPLFHMGGAAVSFVLCDGRTGAVRAAGVVPVHGGFVQADRLQATLRV